MQKVRKAVIPAAGLGTRFLPATKAVPKEMLPIVDKPTIQYIIEEAINSGIEEILIITSRNKAAIEEHFDRNIELEQNLFEHGKKDLLAMVQKISSIRIHSVRQKVARGLGHAILCAKDFVGDEPFAVLLGDDVVYNDEKPALGQLIKAYDKLGGTVLGVQTVAKEATKLYGIVDTDGSVGDRTYSVQDMVENPNPDEAPSRLAVLGRYVITPAIFDILEKTEPGKGGEIQLTDALKVLAKQEKMFAYDFEGRRYDIGDKEGFLEACVEFALRREDLKDKFQDYLRGLQL
ncbi:MAG: UTP--glucose-1-phosphate uridylyltransferase GalU [Acidaminococcaceae bacterium]|nr:UTP--glucose-1-phosphate uridylyltransferase GalU [Acidaminococcaceae bacterium]